MDARTSRYHEIYARSLADPEGFWGEAAAAIDWYEPAKKVFDKDAGVYGRWFAGAVCNTCYNAIDRHVERGRGRPGGDHLRLAGHQHQARHHLCGAAARGRDARRRAAGLRRHQGRPRHPLHADGARGAVRHVRLRAHRRDPLGGVRRVRGERACDPPRRLQAEADPLGLAAASRSRASFPTSRCSTRRSISRRHKPEACLILQRPQCEAPLTAGRDHDWALAAREGARREQVRALRAGARDRPALHPLHLRHDRHPERRGARQRRPHGRARLVDAEPLRRRARRGVLGGLRHRLGGRALLHRLRAAVPRLHHDPLRGQAGRHAGRGRVLARHRRAQMRRDVHGADRVPRDQEGRPERQAVRAVRPVELPHAVPRRRARRSADRSNGPSSS